MLGIWIEFRQQLVQNVTAPILLRWDGGCWCNRKSSFGQSKGRAGKVMIYDVSQPTAKLPSKLEKNIRQYLLQIQSWHENETIAYIVMMLNNINTSCIVLKYPISQIEFWVQITWEISPFPISFWMWSNLETSGRKTNRLCPE